VQHRFFRLALVSLGALLLCGQAPPPLRDLPQQQAAPLRDEEVTVTPQAIRLHLKDRPLQEVLQYIKQASGIRFSLPQTLLTVPVTAEIEAPDWPTAVRQLLLPFQTAEVWQDGETQLRQIFILESAAATPAPAAMPPAPPDSSVQPETPGATERQSAQ
jgi:hypothetical protein